MTQDNAPDPDKVTVQLNIPITWQLKRDIMSIAENERQSVASLVRACLEANLQDELQELKRERERAAVLNARNETR